MGGIYQMEDKNQFNVYLSYWKKGNNSRVYDIDIDLFLINKFLEFHRKRNPNINFKFIEIDGYDNYQDGWWPIVKLLNMLNLPQPLFHIDFDIFWDIDFEELIKWLLLNDIRCLYQSKDMFYNEYKTFTQYFNGFNKQEPYCAGITWWNKVDTISIKESIDNMIKKIPLNLNQFWIGMGVEQLYVPYEINKQNITVFTLIDIKENIKNFTSYRNIEKPDNLLVNKWIDLHYCNSIIPDINYYHFMGDIKNIKSFKNDLNNWNFLNK